MGEKGDGRVVTESPDGVRAEQSCLELETLPEAREKLTVKEEGILAVQLDKRLFGFDTVNFVDISTDSNEILDTRYGVEKTLL